MPQHHYTSLRDLETEQKLMIQGYSNKKIKHIMAQFKDGTRKNWVLDPPSSHLLDGLKEITRKGR